MTKMKTYRKKSIKMKIVDFIERINFCVTASRDSLYNDTLWSKYFRIKKEIEKKSSYEALVKTSCRGICFASFGLV